MSHIPNFNKKIAIARQKWLLGTLWRLAAFNCEYGFEKTTCLKINSAVFYIKKNSAAKNRIYHILYVSKLSRIKMKHTYLNCKFGSLHCTSSMCILVWDVTSGIASSGRAATPPLSTSEPTGVSSKL
jgi:hypothetical protein